MTSRFTELIVDSSDPRALAEFWCEVLGYHIVDDKHDWVEIAPWPDLDSQPPMAELFDAAGVPSVIFVPDAGGKSGKNRLHLDLLPIDCGQDEEVERLVALGARRMDIGQGEVPWRVLADPEGNEFCVGQVPNSPSGA